MNNMPVVTTSPTKDSDLMKITPLGSGPEVGRSWFLKKTTFRGKCYMMHATKSIFIYLLSDYIKVIEIS